MARGAVRYTVSMLRAKSHYLDVSMEVRAPEGTGEDQLRLGMPVWTPGHYVIEDFPRNVTGVKASDAATGRELTVTKLTKSTWSVALQGAGAIRVEYSVYAFAYNVNGSYIDGLHALINGASVFLYVEGMKWTPVRLALEPPPEWKSVATGLEKVSDWEFAASDYDVLVDSPLEAGNQEVHSFDTGGASYEVSVFGRAPVDTHRFVADIRKIVEKTTPIFGQVPYKRYVFLVNFTDTTGGGLEHLNSTMCFVPRFKLLPKEEYDSAMSLFSHEFFHAWNVKRMKPAGLGPFDYSGETYTKSLWIAEGVTSYYDDLILRRAELYSVEEYLDALAVNINQMKSLPGSRRQSAEEASFDAWTKYYRQDENSPNVTSSYYTQGAVVGWMLDMEVRRASGGTKSLDDVMRKVYNDAFLKENRGYTDAEFEAACVGLGGEGVKSVFDLRVRGREDVDYDSYLKNAGLRLLGKDQNAGERGYLGVRLSSDGGRTMVRTILAGSPAEEMGLAVNDEVIGIGGLRMGLDRISFYVATMKPGDKISLTMARNGRLMELEGRVGARPQFEYRIQPDPGATEAEKGFFAAWLGSDWKAEIRYPDYARSPDRKPAFDYA